MPRLQYIDFSLNSISTGDCSHPNNGSHVSDNLNHYKKLSKCLTLQSNLSKLSIVQLFNTFYQSINHHPIHTHQLIFLLIDLPSLTSILMDNGACMEFSSLNLTLLPQLTDLIIGSDETPFNSYSFYCAKSCTICDLPALQTLELGSHSFFATRELVFKKLPSLISLSIGNACFLKLPSFELSGLDSLYSLSIGNNCMNAVQKFTLKGRVVWNDGFTMYRFEAIRASHIGI